MGLFSNLSQTQVMIPGQYLERAGIYLVRVNKVKAGKNFKGVQNRVIECTILAILPHNYAAPQHEPGDECAQVIAMSSMYAQSSWVNFFSTLMEVPVAQLDNPEIRAACGNRDCDDWASNDNPVLGPVQPLRGMVGVVNVHPKMTAEKPGKPSKLIGVPVWERSACLSEVLKALTPDQVTRFFPNDAAKALVKQG